jgi:mannose/fructose/N-acetylgalactosamine-specific phosphotransferase system component IIC
MSLWQIIAFGIACCATAALKFLYAFDAKSAIVAGFILFLVLYDLDRLQKR